MIDLSKSHKTVIAKSGDTISDIAERETGRAKNWLWIARLNGISNPDLIYPGQKIIIPNL